MVVKEGQTKTVNNTNNIRVHNRFSLTVHFGDSLNLLTLLAGVYIIRSVAKKRKQKKKAKKESRENVMAVVSPLHFFAFSLPIP